MQNQGLKKNVCNCSKNGFFRILMLLCCSVVCFSGCATLDVLEFINPEKGPSDEVVSRNYYRIVLKETDTAEALDEIYLPDYELLSQSKSVIASAGQKKEGYKLWFKMVAFDEDTLTAQRRYLLIEDEKPKILFREPWMGFEFKCRVVIPKDVLEKPYNSENARRVAIFRQVLKSFREDISRVELDNKQLAICGMLVNQAMEAVLLKLDKSPAEASKLHEPEGVEFDHLSLDKGRVLMTIWDDIASVKIKLGSFEHLFEDDDSPKPAEIDDAECPK